MEFLNSISTFMSGAGGKGLQSLLGLAGLGTNIYTGIEQQQQAQKQAAAQDYVRGVVSNPAKLAAAEAGYTQPLTAGLTSDITNTVQANLAERGMGYSPAAYTQQLTQALAPYIQANRQTGQANLLNALQLMVSGSNPYAGNQMQNLSAILKQLQMPSTPSPGMDTGISNPLDMGGPNEPPPDWTSNVDPFAGNDPFSTNFDWSGILPAES